MSSVHKPQLSRDGPDCPRFRCLPGYFYDALVSVVSRASISFDISCRTSLMTFPQFLSQIPEDRVAVFKLIFSGSSSLELHEM